VTEVGGAFGFDPIAVRNGATATFGMARPTCLIRLNVLAAT
jgi:hypothetical protein